MFLLLTTSQKLHNKKLFYKKVHNQIESEAVEAMKMFIEDNWKN